MQGVWDVFLPVLYLFGTPQNQEPCQSGSLVHPFLDQLRERSILRYDEGWDAWNMSSYMKNVHEDVHVELLVKDQVSTI